MKITMMVNFFAIITSGVPYFSSCCFVHTKKVQVEKKHLLILLPLLLLLVCSWREKIDGHLPLGRGICFLSGVGTHKMVKQQLLLFANSVSLSNKKGYCPTER